VHAAESTATMTSSAQWVRPSRPCSVSDPSDRARADYRRYGDTSVRSSLCGRSVRITNTQNGRSVNVFVADACPTCENGNSIDLSMAAFEHIADLSEGVVPSASICLAFPSFASDPRALQSHGNLTKSSFQWSMSIIHTFIYTTFLFLFSITHTRGARPLGGRQRHPPPTFSLLLIRCTHCSTTAIIVDPVSVRSCIVVQIPISPVPDHDGPSDEDSCRRRQRIHRQVPHFLRLRFQSSTVDLPGSAVCKAALARGLRVTSIRSVRIPSSARHPLAKREAAHLVVHSRPQKATLPAGPNAFGFSL